MPRYIANKKDFTVVSMLKGVDSVWSLYVQFTEGNMPRHALVPVTANGDLYAPNDGLRVIDTNKYRWMKSSEFDALEAKVNGYESLAGPRRWVFHEPSTGSLAVYMNDCVWNSGFGGWNIRLAPSLWTFEDFNVARRKGIVLRHKVTKLCSYAQHMSPIPARQHTLIPELVVLKDHNVAWDPRVYEWLTSEGCWVNCDATHKPTE